MIKYNWQIKGFEKYKFAENKKLYNCQTGKEINKTVVAYTIGYYLNSKFVSLTKLKPLIEKVKTKNCPF